MIKVSQKFVVAKKEIKFPQGITVEKDDVGIIKSENTDKAVIFFIRIWQQVELVIGDFSIVNIKKTGDSFPKKICNVCHKLKRTTEFAKNQNGKNNRSVRRPSCHDCRVKMEGIGVSHADKIEWIKKKPNNEPFVCPICKKCTIAGITSKVVLEHNHRTGKPGGWICDSCNTGLGRFKDDIGLLNSAIEFIKKTTKD